MVVDIRFIWNTVTSWLLIRRGLCLNVFIASDSEYPGQQVLQVVEKVNICCDETLPIAEYSTRYMEFICKLRVKPNAEFTCIMRSIGHA